jgi:hypothetical protein
MTGCADAPLRSRRVGKLGSLIILLALAACFPGFALTLVYTERSDPRQSDERAVTHTFIIDPAPGGYEVTVSSQRQGGLVVYQKLRTNEGFSVREWWYLDEAKATEFTAIREGSVIRLAGRRGTRSVSRTFAVDDSPWYQLFPHGLEQLVASGGQGLRFWAVGSRRRRRHAHRCLPRHRRQAGANRVWRDTGRGTPRAHPSGRTGILALEW